MNEKNVLEMLGALSQETRLRIVRYLVAQGEEGASAGDVRGMVMREGGVLAALGLGGAAVAAVGLARRTGSGQGHADGAVRRG